MKNDDERWIELRSMPCPDGERVVAKIAPSPDELSKVGPGLDVPSIVRVQIDLGADLKKVTEVLWDLTCWYRAERNELLAAVAESANGHDVRTPEGVAEIGRVLRGLRDGEHLR